MDSRIQTFTGRYVDPLRLRPEDVCIEDIAAGLSNAARFTGHTRTVDGASCFYSVAQHSVYVSWWCDPEDALAGILHDASEAYLTDIPRPLKYLPEFAFYREAEKRAQIAIYNAFGIPWKCRPSIKRADLKALRTEARDLMGDPDWSEVWGDIEPNDRRIYPWDPEWAHKAFVARFSMLTRERVAA